MGIIRNFVYDYYITFENDRPKRKKNGAIVAIISPE